MKNALYIACCLIIPILWGIGAARAFDWFAARRRKPEAPIVSLDSGDMYEI